MLYSYSKKYTYIILRRSKINEDTRLISSVYSMKSLTEIKTFK